MKLRISLLSLLFASSPSFSGDPEFIDFAVKQAHNQGFTGCDTAIREVFEHASGQDIRIETSTMTETPNQLRMTSVWGSKGDSLLNNTIFTKVGSQCTYNEITILKSSKSCMAYSNEMSMFEYKAETGDYIWTKNKGGINMFLNPTDSGCMATYIKSSKA